ncbi:MAG: HesA/MoeB/ThiF family protein [Micavibrio aeruginosavorus]|uniref:Molybdopterin-synthase adenylyltransferase n=1 Tax=Micavibrio aeruginosavorus TaxID=349221 RepID=A0A7T5R4E1_9BACT|nr:MAG: HesA/MoeB/ThiF family protein [Micavibrio aeruginosavorus]
MNSARYSRQTILPEMGTEGQMRLAAARLLVVGAGGLGCPALQYLAAAGVGTIGIIDHDRVDISNLQRQILFATADAGKPKAQTARARLQDLNPDITLHAFDTELNDRNAQEIFSAYDIVLDCTDNFPAKFLINDMAVKLGKPVVYGAIQGFEGQVAIFDAAHGPCYRCLHPQPPRGLVLNCAEAGVIGALAGMIGAMQAMEAIKLIVGHESFSPLKGKLFLMDVKTMDTQTIIIPKNHDCAICSRPQAEIVPQYASPVCFSAEVRDIEIAALGALQECLMIDVREQEEWDQGHIPDALHLALSILHHDPEVFSPYRHRTCVLYCQRGARSRKAAEILLRAGFSDLYSLKGGYDAWSSAKA